MEFKDKKTELRAHQNLKLLEQMSSGELENLFGW